MNIIEKRSWGLPKWITDLFILNPPKFGYADYKSISNFKNKLIFISSRDSYIPCLFYRLPKSPNFLIYFHGNSEHIFQIEHYGLDFRSHLGFNVIIVEYPGYSIYEYDKPDPNLIFENSLIVYEWVKKTFNAKDDKIFVCGRSLGTSPSIFLASHKKVQALFLISAFTSINDIGSDHNISLFLEDIFKSYKYIQKVNCYTLLIHGEKDNLINYSHSVKLKEELEKNNRNIKVEIHNGKDNDHNNFYLRNDIIEPIKNFLEKYHLISKAQINDMNPNEISKIYKMPESISRKIESKIFKISNFILHKKVEDVKNANFIMKLIDNRIALISDGNILIYNSKNYKLDELIIVCENCNQNIEINCLFQMKNQNLICSTNNGDIIMYKINTDSDEYEEVKHEIIDSKILKIDKLNEGFICILTKNGILIYDDNDFNKIDTINLREFYYDFVHISGQKLAMLQDNYLSIFEIGNIKGEYNSKKLEIQAKTKKDALITTGKYLILGGKKIIYHIDHSLNIINIYQIDGCINNIHKIHNELFLAASDKGDILQIKVIREKRNDILIIDKKFFINDEINYVILKNINTILFTYKNGFQVFTNPKKEEDSCKII